MCFCLPTESSDTLHKICGRAVKVMIEQIGIASGDAKADFDSFLEKSILSRQGANEIAI